MISRRLFIGGLLAASTGPAIVRSGILMPVREIITPDLQWWVTIPLRSPYQDEYEYTFSVQRRHWSSYNDLVHFHARNEWWNSPHGGMFDGRAVS